MVHLQATRDGDETATLTAAAYDRQCKKTVTSCYIISEKGSSVQAQRSIRTHHKILPRGVSEIGDDDVLQAVCVMNRN